MKKNNQYLWFIAIVFAISFLWDYLIFRTGGVKSPLFSLLMWIPGLVTIVFLIIFKDGFRKIGWGIGRWWTILAAVFIPLTVSLIIAFLLVTFNLAIFTGRLFLFNDGMVEISNIKLILGNQSQSILFFILNHTCPK